MITVLLPQEVKNLACLPKTVRAIYYRQNRNTLLQRLQKKIAPASYHDSLEDTLIFETADSKLEDAEAFWMAPGISLSSDKTEQLLDLLPNLKWVYSQKAGTDHLALASYKNRSVKVSHTGNLVSAWVAQMNLACILSHAKNIPNHILRQRRFNSDCLYVDDITRQTVGIIGTGNIGIDTARMCTALGMTVIGLSRNPATVRDKQLFDGIEDIKTDLNGVLTEIDYLVLTLPLNNETRGFINAATLTLMKPSACIINLARPQIVNEKDLLNALINGMVGSAYISGLPNLSRFERIRAAWLPNLVQTHYSDAHVREKNLLAFEQFLANLEKLQAEREVANRIV